MYKKLYLLLFVGLCLNQVTWAQIPTSGLVAYYPFNGNANDAKPSGIAWNGSIVGGVSLTTDRNSQSNQAYLFNGSTGYISIPSYVLPSTAFTYSIWFKPTATLTSASARVDLIYGYNVNSGGIARPHLTFGSPTAGELALNINVTTSGNVAAGSNGLNQWDAGTWYHFVATWDGTNLRTYVNNVLKQTTTATGSAVVQTGMNIGAKIASSGNTFFNGAIDDIRIYNVALNATEVNALYTEGSSDTQVPTAPTLSLGTITATSVALSWTGATDNVGISSYDIYNGATLVGNSTTTSYTVSGLTASTAYTFTVKAKDAAGNVSIASNTMNATTSASGTCVNPILGLNFALASNTACDMKLELKGNNLLRLSGGKLFITDEENPTYSNTSFTDPYNLFVKTGIRTERVKIDVQSSWADFVFAPNYKLLPLREVETFIQQHQHLPEVPSEKELKAEGLDVGEMQKIQMQKLEEMMLYLIQINKEKEKLQAELADLRKELEILKQSKSNPKK